MDGWRRKASMKLFNKLAACFGAGAHPWLKLRPAVWGLLRCRRAHPNPATKFTMSLFAVVASNPLNHDPQPTLFVLGHGQNMCWCAGQARQLFRLKPVFVRHDYMAAATNAQVRCWVGLDPVDAGQKGAAAAKGLRIPCAVLLAEPCHWYRIGKPAGYGGISGIKRRGFSESEGARDRARFVSAHRLGGVASRVCRGLEFGPRKSSWPPCRRCL